MSEERRLIVDNMTARRQSPWTMPAQREERQERPKQQEAAPTDLLQKIYRAVRNGLRTDRGKAYFAVQARKNGYTEESANPTAIESAETTALWFTEALTRETRSLDSTEF